MSSLLSGRLAAHQQPYKGENVGDKVQYGRELEAFKSTLGPEATVADTAAAAAAAVADTAVADTAAAATVATAAATAATAATVAVADTAAAAAVADTAAAAAAAADVLNHLIRIRTVAIVEMEKMEEQQLEVTPCPVLRVY